VTVTAHGRPAFVVNVEVFLHREGRWLLIRRAMAEAHAPGTLSGVGGKAEPGQDEPGVLERTARREVAEEVNVDLDGVALTYAESAAFITDDGDPVVNVVFGAELPPGARPEAISPEEVGEVAWMTLAEAVADPHCPPWTVRGLRSASACLT
jgi:8-oxo-dGTP diphosphatase